MVSILFARSTKCGLFGLFVIFTKKRILPNDFRLVMSKFYLQQYSDEMSIFSGNIAKRYFLQNFDVIPETFLS